ncbi:MAG: DUF3786 domain-containing protein [Dehalococcoidales bacterium]
MENKSFTIPDKNNYEQANLLAYKLACEQLAGIDDIESRCRKSGAEYRVEDFRKEVLIRYLDQSYRIAIPGGEISPLDNDGELPIREKLLIIHYFISAKGTPAAGRLINFRELPEGNVYAPTFDQRTIRPLLNNFAAEPDRLVEISKKFGGRPADFGDTAVTINAFERVLITIVIWKGDDELAPQGNILFDANISDYLPTEDITVLCETITWKLIRNSR